MRIVVGGAGQVRIGEVVGVAEGEHDAEIAVRVFAAGLAGVDVEVEVADGRRAADGEAERRAVRRLVAAAFGELEARPALRIGADAPAVGIAARERGQRRGAAEVVVDQERQVGLAPRRAGAGGERHGGREARRSDHGRRVYHRAGGGATRILPGTRTPLLPRQGRWR